MIFILEMEGTGWWSRSWVISIYSNTKAG